MDAGRFAYLGTKTRRRMAYTSLRLIWRNENVYLKSNPRLFSRNVRSVLLHGLETLEADRKLPDFTYTY